MIQLRPQVRVELFAIFEKLIFNDNFLNIENSNGPLMEYTNSTLSLGLVSKLFVVFVFLNSQYSRCYREK